MTELKKTPFHDRLVDYGGRFIDFFGWRMPVQFTSIIEEHRHVREHVGVFDVSHMGEIVLRGPRALEAADLLVTNSVASLADGAACYSPMCLHDGGIVDDLILYRRAADEVFICCNASNREKDVRWVREQVGAICEVVDASDGYGQLAVQGPHSPEVIIAAFPEEGPSLAELPPFRHRTIEIDGVAIIVATTGYTGERGFELYIPQEAALTVWDRLVEAGAPYDLRPIGLGARDTLRLEMRYCLYGNDIDETTTPIEAGLAWTVDFDKSAFNGKAVIERQHKDKPKRRLVGFKLLDRGIARHGYDLYAADEPDRKVGAVTSGTRSPSLELSIGLGYVDAPYHKRGRELLVDIRGQKRRAKIIRTPFLKR